MKIKREVWMFLIVFVLALLMCMAFLQPHYTHDTYYIEVNGYAKYTAMNFLPEGRPITGLVMILAELINIDIEVLGVISFVIAIAFLSLSVVLLYKIMTKENKNISNQVITLLVSFLIIFNYLMIEHIYFLESSIMSLGILLSVYACKVFTNNEKYRYLKSYLLLLVAVFCYQGSIAIFPMIILTYYAIVEKYDWKTYLKLIIKLMLIYGSLMLLNMMFSKFLFNGTRFEMGAVSITLSNLITTAKNLVVDSLNVLLPYMHIGILVITLIILCIAKNSYHNKIQSITKYLIIILGAIAICLMPAVVGSSLELQPRTCIAFGATIGISFWFMLDILENGYHKKSLKWIIFSMICIVSILNIALYFIITHQHIRLNQLDRDILNKVSEKIVQYEEDNGITITKLAIVYDKNTKEYEDWVIKTPAYNIRGTASWAARYAIENYTKKDLIHIYPDKEVAISFLNKDWEEFSEEQIYMVNDTLYFCVY